MERKSSIDAIRFYLVFSIIYGHLMQHFAFRLNPFFLQKMRDHFTFYFGFACEMLFIISGYFLTNHFQKKGDSIMFVLSSYVIKKCARLSPVVAFCSMFIIIFKALGWYDIHYSDIIFQNLFLTDIGLGPRGIDFLWYISVMFYVLPFYLYLYHIVEYRKFIFIVLFLIFLSYSSITAACGPSWYSKPYAANSIAIFLLRGVAGIGIGCLLGEFVRFQWNNKISLKLSGMVSTIVECLLLLALIYLINIRGALTPLVAPFFFVCFFYVFLQNLGIISRFLSLKIFSAIGRYGYSTYVMSFPCFVFSERVFVNNAVFNFTIYPIPCIILFLLFNFSVGVVTFHYIEKPGALLVDRVLKSKFLIPSS